MGMERRVSLAINNMHRYRYQRKDAVEQVALCTLGMGLTEIRQY